jgi:protein-disulfide isomerase
MTLLSKTLKALTLCAALSMGAPFARAQTPGHDAPLVNSELSGIYNEISGDHTLGAQNAPVTIIIYASVTCPHCAHWFTGVWPSLKASHVETGKVRIVFREFPTAPTAIAYAGFLLANCAPKDQFFPIIEHQMKEQDHLLDASKNGKGRAAYLEVAKLAGLDEAGMNTCLADEEKIDAINHSVDLADAADIHSVPSFIINGALYKGSSDILPLLRYLDGLDTNSFTPLPELSPAR